MWFLLTLALASSPGELVGKLGSGDSDDAVTELIALGDEAVPALVEVLGNGEDRAAQGWAIVCLAGIGTSEANAALERVWTDPTVNLVVRRWAAAGRVRATSSLEELEALVTHRGDLGLGDAVTDRIVELVDDDVDVDEAALLVGSNASGFARVREGLLDDTAIEPLATVMFSDADPGVRRRAGQALYRLQRRHPVATLQAVREALRFEPDADEVPWADGDLLVRALELAPGDERVLAAELMAWRLWAELQGEEREALRIELLLSTLSIFWGARFYELESLDDWLHAWAHVAGPLALERTLLQNDVVDEPRYASILDIERDLQRSVHPTDLFSFLDDPSLLVQHRAAAMVLSGAQAACRDGAFVPSVPRGLVGVRLLEDDHGVGAGLVRALVAQLVMCERDGHVEAAAAIRRQLRHPAMQDAGLYHPPATEDLDDWMRVVATVSGADGLERMLWTLGLDEDRADLVREARMFEGERGHPASVMARRLLRGPAVYRTNTLDSLRDLPVDLALFDALERELRAPDRPWTGELVLPDATELDPERAASLMGQLVRWHVLHDAPTEEGLATQRQLDVVLLQLREVLALPPRPATTEGWLQSYADLAGRRATRQLIATAGGGLPRYRAALR